MKNLIKLLLTAFTAFTIANAQEPIHIDASKIHHYEKKQNEYDLIFKEGEMKVNKKVTLAYTEEYSKYANLINPESIKKFTSKINSEGKNDYETAKKTFYYLRDYGIKYELDPIYPGEKAQEKEYAEYLMARIVKGEEPDNKDKKTKILQGQGSYLILESEAPDYLREPSQTLKDKKGDCEDLAGLYGSFLYPIPTVMVKFEALDSLGDTIRHLMPIFMPEREEGQKFKYSLIFPDGSLWLPVEATAIDTNFTFEKAVGVGFRNFEESFNYDIFILKE